MCVCDFVDLLTVAYFSFFCIYLFIFNIQHILWIVVVAVVVAIVKEHLFVIHNVEIVKLLC